MRIFKELLSHSLHICLEKYLAKGIYFLKNVFAENKHSITFLEKVTKNI